MARKASNVNTIELLESIGEITFSENTENINLVKQLLDLGYQLRRKEIKRVKPYSKANESPDWWIIYEIFITKEREV